MNKREKIICGISITIGLLLGCLFGMVYQQERLLDGAVELGESITGNTIVIDINETVLVSEMTAAAKEIREQQQYGEV